MASTTTQGVAKLPDWALLDALTSDQSRFVDLCAIFRRNDADGNPTGEILLEVGGVWDRSANDGKGAFDRSRTPRQCKIWGVNEAQLEAVEDVATYFAKRRVGDKSRIIVESLGGPRGSGKTRIAVQFAAAFNIELPGSKAWIFSPTLDKREEVEDFYRESVPIRWARNRQRWPTSVPDCRFRLLNGSSTRSLTGEIPQNAKRGEADYIAINEGQQQRRKVFSLSIYGIRRNGGLLTVAHNPPQVDYPAGEWVVDLVESIEAGKFNGSHRWMDPRRNPSVSSETMEQIGAAVAAVDSEAAVADVEGTYKRLGDFVYSRFRAQPKIINIEPNGPLPVVGAEWPTEYGTAIVKAVSASRIRVELPSMVLPTPETGDITAEMLHKAGWSGRQSVAIGTDHQTYPHQVGVAIRAFRGEDQRVLYWVSDEILVWGSSVTEAELSHALYSGDGAQGIEYSPDVALLVPDSSGSWQRAARQKGASSIGEMQALGWKCKPPTEIMQPDKSRFPANPPVHRSVALMADVMREGRFFVDPACKWVIESGPKVPYQKDGDRVKISQAGGYAHAWDCIRYVLWLLEPKKVRQPPVTKTPRAESFRGSRLGSGFRF